MPVTRSAEKLAAFDALVHVAKMCEAIYAIEEEDAASPPPPPPSPAITITSGDTVALPSPATTITISSGDNTEGNGVDDVDDAASGGDQLSACGATFAPVRRAKGTILRVGNLFDNNDNDNDNGAATAVSHGNAATLTATTTATPTICAPAAVPKIDAFNSIDDDLAHARERFMAAVDMAAREAWAEIVYKRMRA